MSKTIKGRLKNLDKYIQSKWEEHYWNFLMKYEDRLDWNGISQNTFKKEKELFYEKWYKIYMASFRLQQYFNRMYDNPNYLFCRTRLEKLFS